MAQTFSRSEVFALKLVLIGALLLVVTGVALWRWNISAEYAMNAPVSQPIPFSHKHHVGDDGIDCRYCHTTVEDASFAGLPSTGICLTCHSQLFRDSPLLAPLFASQRDHTPIRWNRVHDLPDFVFFDHGIHVHKGVACVECHGRIDQMPLTWRVASLDMQWCLACHRDPARHLRPPGQVFSMDAAAPLTARESARLAGTYQLQDTRRLTDCSTCHR